MRFKRQFRRFRGKRRIRGSQGTWFPILGSSWTDEDTFNDTSFTFDMGGVFANRSLGPQVYITPITRDYTPQNIPSTEPVEQQPSLRDFTEGQDYILKRLVGNVDVICNSGQDPALPWSRSTYWSFIKATAGFFVARASDNDQSLPDLTTIEIDPQDSRNAQNPWIWRRSWILANPAMNEPVSSGNTYEDELATNRSFSDLRGPSIDTKSKRRIRREERLWFALSAIGWDNSRGTVSSASDQPFISGNLDVRLFGKMVKGRNSSTF